jgi:hypothetical protein
VLAEEKEYVDAILICFDGSRRLANFGNCNLGTVAALFDQ